ncbi:MAG: hypothetical protein JWO06_811 [Bacteroidota bacterium]|nr:hypothetical protein [Bacteroidota bacterium]
MHWQSPAACIKEEIIVKKIPPCKCNFGNLATQKQGFMNRGIIRNLKLALMWSVVLPVTFFSYIIAWLDRNLKFWMPFPRDTDQLAAKQQWCAKALKKNGVLPSDAIINNYKVKSLSQDTIFRSNIGVLEIAYTSNGASNTLKCMAKFAPTVGSVWNRTIFNLQLNHIKEIFFNKHFVAVDKEVASPAVYCAELSIFTGNFCLIMEYMGDCIEYPLEELPAAQFDRVLDGMAALHAKYWKDNSKRMGLVFPILETHVDFFDSMVAGKWSINARNILVKSWNCMNAPETIIHGDARVGNMMFPNPAGGGRFVFIDWQAVRKGKGAFDLAYFLVLSLTSEKLVEVEQTTLETYHRYLISKGVKDYAVDNLKRDYNHACLCVLLLLALPMLSGEASAEGEGAKIFAWGMNIWRERLQEKFKTFDYVWMAQHYGLAEKDSRAAIDEMLNVIDARLKGIMAGANV